MNKLKVGGTQKVIVRGQLLMLRKFVFPFLLKTLFSISLEFILLPVKVLLNKKYI